MNASPGKRDWIAFIGLAPLVLLAYAGLVLVDYGIWGYAKAIAGEFALLLVPLAIPGLLVIWPLVLAWWRLLATDRPQSASMRNALLLILAIAGIVVFGLLQQYGTTSAPHEWSNLAAWTLGVALAAFLAATALLVLAHVKPRTPAFRAAEAVAIGLAWLVVALAVPALQYRGHAREEAKSAAVVQALRVRTASRDPFIMALCNDDAEKAWALLGTLSEQAARDAATCIPDDIARRLREPGVSEYSAGMLMTVVDQAVVRNDPLVTMHGRHNGACTVAEANLLRRIVDVAPDRLAYLHISHLPTDCVEDDAARTPIWWRVSRRWAAGAAAPESVMHALKMGHVNLDQADANGLTLSLDPMTKAASAP